jgi:phosphoserine phosphatase
MLENGELVLVIRNGADVAALRQQLIEHGVTTVAAPEAASHVQAATKNVLPLQAIVDPARLREIVLQHQMSLLAWALRPATLRPVGLLVFDTDSTFINEEVIDEIAGYAGYKAHVAAITERAMRGELDFNTALAERVHLLKGLPEHTLDAVLRTKITLTSGAADLIAAAKSRGVHTYLLSGGFTFFTGALSQSLGMTGHFANELEIVDGHLTGRTLGPIVNRQRKAELLRELAAKHAIPLRNTVAVGDGANDIDMLSLSGLGIAFCAKPALVEASNAAIFERDLRLVQELIF